MAYIPPALRANSQVGAPDATLGITAEAAGPRGNLPPDTALPSLESIAPTTFSKADVHRHYWDSQSDESGTSPTPFGVLSPSTLNSSAEAPDKLKYIMLFRGANPRWHSHGIIFVKSKLHILPGGELFRDELLPEISPTRPTRPEQSGDVGCESRGSNLENETPADEAGAPGNLAFGDNSLVKDGQVGDKLLAPEEHFVGKERREDNEKMDTTEECGKNSGGSTESGHPVATPASHDAHGPINKAAPNMDCDGHHEPNLEPPYSPDLSFYDTEPIAVFEQVSTHRGPLFRFAGYYKIANLEYLAPHSRELLRLLEQKFTTTDRFGRPRQQQRSAESWMGSMSHRWAVIRMEKDQDADGGLAPPEIEVGSDLVEDAGSHSPKKSVNELLRELRLEG